MWGPSFSSTKAKPQLKMAVQRIAMITNKHTQLIKRKKKEIAQILRDGREEKARIKTESVVRDDLRLEALDILSLLCELLHERMALIASLKECPEDMKQSVSTLIWAAPRVEVPELVKVAKLFKAKYGKEFFLRAQRDAGGIVNPKVKSKLSVTPPKSLLVLSYMKEIARSNNVDYTFAEQDDEEASQPMRAPTGATTRSGFASGVSGAFGQMVTADIVVTGQKVKCGQCSALLAVPAGVRRFACSNCGAVLEAPSGGAGGDKGGGFQGGGGGGGFGGYGGGGNSRSLNEIPSIDIPMPPTGTPEITGGISKNSDPNSGGSGNGGGGSGGGCGGLDIPMPPSSLPGGFDIPMPPTTTPGDGSAVFMDKDKGSGAEAGGDRYAAEAAALAARLANMDSPSASGGTSTDIPEPPTVPPVDPVDNNSGSGGSGGGAGGGGGVPSFDDLQARFAALQGR